jgi:hypothetical protein
VVGALWAADLLGRYAEQGTTANFRFNFKGKAEHYYALVDVQNNPRPEYYTYWLYAQLMGEKYVSVAQGNPNDISQLAAHAAVRSQDGALTVVLVNKTTSPKRVSLNLDGFTPFTAQAYTLQGDSFGGTRITLNGANVTPAQLAGGLAKVPPGEASPCPQSLVTVPAYGAVFVSFGP